MDATSVSAGEEQSPTLTSAASLLLSESGQLNTLSTAGGDVTEQFATYDDYLDAQVSATDLFYLEDKAIARQLVELGYRGEGDILSRAAFAEKQQQQRAKQGGDSSNSSNNSANNVNSGQIGDTASGKDTAVDAGLTPFSRALMDREEAIRQGRLASVVFLRVEQRKGTADATAQPPPSDNLAAAGVVARGPTREVSGYVDLADRLTREQSFQRYYTRGPATAGSIMQPRKSDLSYFDWQSGQCCVTDSAYFHVDADQPGGLVFRHRHDRKIIPVWPAKFNTSSSTAPMADPDLAQVARTPVTSPEYLQVVFYDHVIRRKV